MAKEKQPRTDHRFRLNRESGNLMISKLLENGYSEISRQSLELAILSPAAPYANPVGDIASLVDARDIVPLDRDCPEVPPPFPADIARGIQQNFGHDPNALAVESIRAIRSYRGPELASDLSAELEKLYDGNPAAVATLVSAFKENPGVSTVSRYAAGALEKCTTPLTLEHVPLADVLSDLLEHGIEHIRKTAMQILQLMPSTAPQIWPFMIQACGSKKDTFIRRAASEWLARASGGSAVPPPPEPEDPGPDNSPDSTPDSAAA